MTEGSYKIEVSVSGIEQAKRDLASVGEAGQSVSGALASINDEGGKVGDTLAEAGKDGAAALDKSTKSATALQKELAKAEATAKRLPSNLNPLTPGRVPGSGVSYDPLPPLTRSPELQAAFAAAERAKAEREALAALAANTNTPPVLPAGGGRGGGLGGGPGGGDLGGGSARKAAESFERANTSAATFGRTIGSFVTPVLGALAGVVAGTLLKAFTEFNDKVAQSKRDLEEFGHLGEDTAKIIGELDDTAKQIGTSFDKVGDAFLSFQDYAATIGQLTRSNEEASSAFNTLAGSMQVSGASGDAIAKVFALLARDAETGTLSVGTLNAILEQSRGTVERVAEATGRSFIQFKTAVANGTVSVDEFTKALNRPSLQNKIADELKKIEDRGRPTAQSLDLIKDALLRLGGAATEASGFRKFLSDAASSFTTFVDDAIRDSGKLQTVADQIKAYFDFVSSGGGIGAAWRAMPSLSDLIPSASNGPQLTPGEVQSMNAMQQGYAPAAGADIAGSESMDRLIGLTETTNDLLAQEVAGTGAITVSYRDAAGNIVSAVDRAKAQAEAAANDNRGNLQNLGQTFERAVQNLGQSFDSAVRNFQQSSAFGSSPGGGGGYVIPDFNRARQLDVRGAYLYGAGNYEQYWQVSGNYVSQEIRPTASYLANEKYINADKVMRDYRYGLGTAEQALKALKQLGFNPDAPMYRELRDAAAGLNDASKNLNGASDHLSAFGAAELYGVGKAVAPVSLGNFMGGLGTVSGGAGASTTININMNVQGVTDADSFNKSSNQIVDELTSTLWSRVA